TGLDADSGTTASGRPLLEYGCGVGSSDGRASGWIPSEQPHHRHHNSPARASRADRRLDSAPQGRSCCRLRARESDAMKTNGARYLESLGIPFELQEYEVDPEDLSAITVAKKIGMPPEQVFKTLLTTGGPGDYVFAVIPGDAELDFKKLARAAGLRKAEMAP